MAITQADLVSTHPLLYHMSAQGSWPSIMKHGLLSTTALLDLFEYKSEQRKKIESCRRAEWMNLRHISHGEVKIRDQKPLIETGLSKALPDTMKPEDWYRILNEMVFFFPSKQRLKIMLKAYNNCRNTVLVVPAKSLLEAHRQNVYWSPINSGYSLQRPACRDRNTFIRLGREPKLKHGKNPKKIIEITIKHQVLDIAKHVKCVVEVGKGKPPKTIYLPTKFSDKLAVELHNSQIE